MLEVQPGIAGVWIVNEMRLSDPFALRAELGFNLYYSKFFFPKKTYYYFIPSISVEPRWYFNLKKRVAKSKKISGNTGTFLALPLSYMSNLFRIPNFDIPKIDETFTIIPTFGIRRAIARRFSFETAIGVGYLHNFGEKKRYEEKNQLAINAHLRVGFRLK